MSTVSAGTGWRSTPFGTGDFEVSIGIDAGDAQIDEFETLAYADIAEQEFADDRTLTFRGLSDHELGEGVVRTALTVAETRHVERIVPGGESVFRQRLFSFGGEVELPLARPGAGFWSGARINLGASFDRGSTPETGGREPREAIDDWGARVGGSAQIGRRVRFHMGASRRVRFPSLRELYSGALGRFVPNPGLAPEVLRAVEGGLTGTVEALGAEVEAQAVLFAQSFSNAIVRTGLGDGRFRRENRRRVDAAGLELFGDARWGEVSLGGDLTWQDVSVTDQRLAGGALRAEYQPRIMAGMHVEGPLPAGFRARATVDAVGRQYCVDPDLGADVALDPTATGRSRRKPGVQGRRTLPDAPDLAVAGQPRGRDGLRSVRIAATRPSAAAPVPALLTGRGRWPCRDSASPIAPGIRCRCPRAIASRWESSSR